MRAKLKWLIVVLVATAGVMISTPWSLDNDSWYVMAEGREIVENGVYYEDQLSIHEGLDVTVQNYGFAVIFYLIHSVFGSVGVYIVMLIFNLLLLFLVYKVCMLLSNKNVNLSLLLAVLTDLLLSKWFITTRAQVVSYCILMLVVYLLELYIKRNDTKYLWWIPVLSLFQINLHASLWPIILIVILVYIVDSLGMKRLHLDKYKTRPLIIILINSVLVGFLNPYGFKMMTFILTSYGVPEANETINELHAFNFGDNFSVFLYLVIVGVMLLYIFGKRQKIRMRWLILTFGFLALGINTIKGMSHLILVLLFPLAAIYSDALIEKWGNRKIRWMVGSWAGIMAVCMIVAVTVVKIPEIIDGPSEVIMSAVDVLDNDTEGVDKKDLKIYTGFNNGGYLEYRGYKPYIDPRMEVFIKANNGKEDIFKEWCDLKNGGLKKQEFIDKYDFDFLLTFEDEQLYEPEDSRYVMIFEKKENEDANGVRVWKKM